MGYLEANVKNIEKLLTVPKDIVLFLFIGCSSHSNMDPHHV